MKTVYLQNFLLIFSGQDYTQIHTEHQKVKHKKRISVLQYIQCHYLGKKIEVTKV